MDSGSVSTERHLTALPRRILVPVDVSEFRRETFDLGLRLAAVNDAQIILLSVIDDRFPYPDIFSFQNPSKDFFRHVRDRAQEVLKEAIETVPEGVEVRPLVARGKPPRVIVEVAEEENVDVIIMASHTRRGLEHAILGSVTDRVLRTTSRPVLVVPVSRGRSELRKEDED